MEEYILMHPLGEKGLEWDSKLVEINKKCLIFENQIADNVDLVIGILRIKLRKKTFKGIFDKII